MNEMIDQEKVRQLRVLLRQNGITSISDLFDKTDIQCQKPGCEGKIIIKYNLPTGLQEMISAKKIELGSCSVAVNGNGTIHSIYCEKCLKKYETLPKA